MAQNHSAEYIEKPMTRAGRIQGPSRRYRRLRNPTFPSTEWTAKNPLLQRGEIGIEADTHRIKVGDGLTYWNDLPYSSTEVNWGDIAGDIENQTDLIDLVDGKVAAEAELRIEADEALQSQITTNEGTMEDHIANKANPHEVTKTQVGLGNVDNTSDLDKPISTATQTALDGKVTKNADITGATKCKITYDSKGLVTAGADLAESDIPSLHLSKISDVTATATELNYVDGVTSSIQTQLDSKQATISDLATIRSNANAGKTASDTIATYGNIVTHNVSEFATSAQGALADTSLQPGDNVSELVNDAGYLTQHQTLADLGITATANEINVLDGITASTTELNYVDGVTGAIQTQIDGKQAKSTSSYNMGNSTGGWTAMSNTQQAAINSGANSTNIGQIATNTSNIADEIIDRQNADNGLQQQIDALVAKSDVVDIVGTYADLQAYDTSSLGNNDVVKVLDDSTHNDAPSYYRWVITGGVGAWVYVGSESETYTKAETDALLNAKQDNISATDGITLTGTTLTNSGVRAVASGTANGTISVNTNGTTADVAVTGLGSAAYTSSSDYATATQGGKADTAVQPGDLATVATTGDYNDLTNKPTIPTVNDATLTIQKNGTSVATFTANASSGVTANITVPTATSDLSNDSGFITSSDIPVTDVTVGGTSVVSSGVAVIPAIPTVGNGTITITQGGVTKGTFTTNQSGNTTVDLDAGGGGVGNIDNLTITENASQEIQAVATVNANSAAGATNPIYDWVGTMAEYEAQSVATTHPDWVCYITDDIGGNATDMAQLAEDLNGKVDVGHQVIAFQAPTAANNYTWYRKYADGWVEQGQHYRSGGNGVDITLPIPMADSNYTVRLTQYNNDAGGTYFQCQYYGSTTTVFYVISQYGSSKTARPFDWEVKGIAA